MKQTHRHTNLTDPSRRRFVIHSLTVGAGLALGLHIPVSTATPLSATDTDTDTDTFEPNAFLRIGTDNTVTVLIKHLEMGQGTYTGLSTLVAEELDAAWSQIQVETAPANAQYHNLFWGTQATGGSTSIANAFTQMRQAGASARQMLVSAAAKQWAVQANTITIQAGVVHHKTSGQQATFGQLSTLAAQEPVPIRITLKNPKDFTMIGKAHLPRKDSHDKVYGKAIYTQDIQLPGMLTAVVAHPPRFGASVKSVDDRQAKAVKNVTHVVSIPGGVAVVAKDFWSAKKGRDALQITWDEQHAFKLSSEDITAQYKALLDQPGAVAANRGDAEQALSQAAQTFEATYEFPFLAHAPMEPLNCVIQRTEQGCEIWNGEQFQSIDQAAVAALFGLKPENVKINTLYAGGSFGRRANPSSDFVLEAANIVKAIGGNAPVKMVWTREDDTRGGFYRPLYVHRLKAGLDQNGHLIAWQQRIVGQSIIAGTAFAPVMIKQGIDQTSVEGAANLPYAIPNMRVDLHSPTLGVPVLWWRSVGSTHTAFAVETFIDELATAAKQDAVTFRQHLLKDHPRHLGVLNLAAEKAHWGQALPKGQARGIAVHESFNSYVAQVANITLHADNTFSVDKVIIAVDCGLAINPDIIRAQMEGGMGFGLSAALSSKLTLKEGRVEQSNFHDYITLRFKQMPEVEVHIVASEHPPTGVGEPGTPVIAPAVANALYAATGQRHYQLPLT